MVFDLWNLGHLSRLLSSLPRYAFMTRNDLAKRVKQRPFIPFRLVLT